MKRCVVKMELNTQAGESKDEKVEVGKKLRAFSDLLCYDCARAHSATAIN